jgi:hypothetical protein
MRERRPVVWQLRGYLGVDPVSGKKRYAGRSVEGGKREAQRALARLVTEAEALAAASTPANAEAIVPPDLGHDAVRPRDARSA